MVRWNTSCIPRAIRTRKCNRNFWCNKKRASQGALSEEEYWGLALLSLRFQHFNRPAELFILFGLRFLRLFSRAAVIIVRDRNDFIIRGHRNVRRDARILDDLAF